MFVSVIICSLLCLMLLVCPRIYFYVFVSVCLTACVCLCNNLLMLIAHRHCDAALLATQTHTKLLQCCNECLLLASSACFFAIAQPLRLLSLTFLYFIYMLPSLFWNKIRFTDVSPTVSVTFCRRHTHTDAYLCGAQTSTSDFDILISQTFITNCHLTTSDRLKNKYSNPFDSLFQRPRSYDEHKIL